MKKAVRDQNMAGRGFEISSMLMRKLQQDKGDVHKRADNRSLAKMKRPRNEIMDDKPLKDQE